MKALVHIGPPKTGTTSIQAFLRRNRDLLRANGVATLPERYWIKNLGAAFRQREPGAPWYELRSRASGRNFDQFKQDTTERFQARLKRLPPSTRLLVLSSEGLFSSRRSEIEALAEFLRGYCDQIEIITYLRRQDFLSISKQKNRIRNRFKIKPVTAKYQSSMDYWLQLQKWSAAFGRDNIKVRRFPDSAPTRFDLIEQFQAELAQRADSWRGDFETPEHRNVSWNWQAVEFVRIANSVCRERMQDGDFHRRLLQQIDAQFSSGSKPSITRGLARSIVELYRESNEKVRETFLAAETELFHDDFSRYPKDETELAQQLSTEDAVRMGIEILSAMQQQPESGVLPALSGKRIYHRLRRLCRI